MSLHNATTYEYIAYSSLYFVVLLFSIYQLHRLVKLKGKAVSYQLLFHLAILFSLISRIVVNIVSIWTFQDVNLSLIIDSFPRLFIWTAFCFVLAQWANIYFRSQGEFQRSGTIRKGLILFNVVNYTVGIVFIILIAALNVSFYQSVNWGVVLLTGWYAIMDLAVGITFAVFGRLIYRYLKDVGTLSTYRPITTRFVVVAIVELLCFLIAGTYNAFAVVLGLHLVSFGTGRHASVSVTTIGVLAGLFYVVPEVISIVGMQILMWPAVPKPRSTSAVVNQKLLQGNPDDSDDPSPHTSLVPLQLGGSRKT